MSRQRIAQCLATIGFVSLYAPSADVWAAPGELTAVERNERGNNFGYFEYLPSNYDESQDWPLIVFLSGIGENGDGMLPEGEDRCERGPNYPDGNLCRNLRHGPQSLLYRQLEQGQAGLWNDQERPFVVIAPQNPAPLFAMASYSATALDTFFDWLVENYAIDERRLYLTGMSMGGYSTMLYIAAQPDRFAAVSIMPGISPGADVSACDLVGQNIWAFHGENDTNPFSPFGVANLIRQYRECDGPHPYPRMTIYAGTGHDVWTRTINPPMGMDDPVLATYVAGGTIDLDPYDIDVYSWLLAHDLPDVSAGGDRLVTTDDAPLTITADTIDDDAITYTWTQIDGDPLTLTGTDSASLVVSELAVGSYRFSVLAVDADGQTDTDELTLTVEEGTGQTTLGADESSSTGDAIEASTGDGTPASTGDLPPASTGDVEIGSSGEDPTNGSSPSTEGGDTLPGGEDSSGSAEATSGPGMDATAGADTDSEEESGDTIGSGTDSAGSGTDTAGIDPDGGASSTAGIATGAESGTTASTGASSATTGFDAETFDDSTGGSGSDDGCNCTAAPRPRGALMSALGLFGLLGLRRRRNPRAVTTTR